VEPERPLDQPFRARRQPWFVGIGLLLIIGITAGVAIWDRHQGAIARSRTVDVVLEETRAIVLAAADKLADGPVFWNRQSIIVGLGALFTLIGFALLFRALVTRSRSLERSKATLRESEARCRDFALTSSDWFWESDEQHRFTYQSDHIRAFGQDPRIRIGRTRIDLAADIASEPAKWQEHLAVLDRHEPFRDFVYTRKAGEDPERIISVSGSPFFDRAGRFIGYRGTARDITGKVLAERALRDAKAAAEAPRQIAVPRQYEP
jgi:PAS domain S-box-containing protein